VTSFIESSGQANSISEVDFNSAPHGAQLLIPLVDESGGLFAVAAVTVLDQSDLVSQLQAPAQVFLTQPWVTSLLL